ncbi:hypothetical protein J6590_094266 [Homalodisca vitripennis]|nr:hypothetical protein J6590_103917 [Homalodisca vitripennis]KAG8294815.1 hypothetical protein J6590_094266 [Homalodisca vitripennis]
MGHSERSPLVPTKSGRSERSSMERKPRHVVTRSRACLTLREENFVSSSWLVIVITSWTCEKLSRNCLTEILPLKSNGFHQCTVQWSSVFNVNSRSTLTD